MPYFVSDVGSRIYYEQHGQTGPIVILLHGLASSSHIWARQVRMLQKYCRVYALDFPGHGKSSWQKHYAITEFSDCVKRLMDTCDIQRANIVAISLGCTVALTFAVQYPERVESLILEGPVGGYLPVWNPFGWLDWLVFILLPLALRSSIALFGYHATAQWINTFGVRKHLNSRALENLQQKTDLTTLRDLLWGSAYAPYVGKLSRINAPVLLIRGQNDPMPNRFVSYIRSHLRNVTSIEVPATRHLVAMEKPQEFNAMILRFLGLKPIQALELSPQPRAF